MTTIPAQNAQDTQGVESVEQRFRRLAAIWDAETLVLSNPNLITNHWAFQEIIRMGPDVVPLLLRDLEQGPHLWVWALPEITGEDPVPPSDAGNIRKMSEAWVRWGRQKGVGFSYS
jgi:hypothetical protein